MSNGNREEWKKRRKKMIQIVPRAPTQYELIDGNLSFYPYAYCKRKHGYLTYGLVKTHKCDIRNCEQYERTFIL